MQNLLEILGIILIIEGLMPALFPKTWQKMLAKIGLCTDNQLRVFGLVLITIGAILLKFLS